MVPGAGPGHAERRGNRRVAAHQHHHAEWQQGTDADLAGYEVLWRETTSPDWTNVQAVGNVTTATIDLSKDRLFFGVRAVDTDGNRSPVAFPQPTT